MVKEKQNRQWVMGSVTKTAILLPLLAYAIGILVVYLQSASTGLTHLERRYGELRQHHHNSSNNNRNNNSSNNSNTPVNIAFVTCGSKDRMDEVRVMMKSAVLFANRPLNFIAFTDSLGEEIAATVSEWNATGLYSPLSADVRKPDHGNIDADVASSIRNAFPLCGTIRIFFANVLKDYDRVIYVDTDVVFLAPPEDIYSQFDLFDSEHLMGIADENRHEKYNIYHYSHFPAPRFGLNSGVMLMDLAKMRESDWSRKMCATYRHMREHMLFHDQDMLNIYFHYHPEEYFRLPCRMNFRPDFCVDLTMSCDEVSSTGVDLLHGNRRAFLQTQTKQPFLSLLAEYTPRLLRWTVINVKNLVYAATITPVVEEEQKVFTALYRVMMRHDMKMEADKDLKAQFEEEVEDRSKCGGIADSVSDSLGRL